MDIDIKCCSEDDRKLITEETTNMENTSCVSLVDLREKYDIKEDRLVLRLLALKGAIKKVSGKNINYDNLLGFLNGIIEVEEEIPLTDKLNKFLITKTNTEISDLYKETIEEPAQKTIGVR